MLSPRVVTCARLGGRTLRLFEPLRHADAWHMTLLA